ncbi:MAG: hypothetical protein RLZZ234_586 [Candidatus Parcubacteria bacterium]
MKIASTDKGHVVENVASLTGIFEGVTVVLLDMKELGEHRYRLRTPGGSEARITESVRRHVQETRTHRARILYQIDKGWGACVTRRNAHLVVDMAFANDDNFVLDVPKNIPYVVVLSEHCTFHVLTNDKVASIPATDALYNEVRSLTDADLFAHYAKHSGTSIFDTQDKVSKSFKTFVA